MLQNGSNNYIPRNNVSFVPLETSRKLQHSRHARARASTQRLVQIHGSGSLKQNNCNPTTAFRSIISYFGNCLVRTRARINSFIDAERRGAGRDESAERCGVFKLCLLFAPSFFLSLSLSLGIISVVGRLYAPQSNSNADQSRRYASGCFYKKRELTRVNPRRLFVLYTRPTMYDRRYVA